MCHQHVEGWWDGLLAICVGNPPDEVPDGDTIRWIHHTKGQWCPTYGENLGCWRGDVRDYWPFVWGIHLTVTPSGGFTTQRATNVLYSRAYMLCRGAAIQGDVSPTWWWSDMRDCWSSVSWRRLQVGDPPPPPQQRAPILMVDSPQRGRAISNIWTTQLNHAICVPSMMIMRC